jgi:hypothetical protein
MMTPFGKLVYLASPYTHPDRKVEKERFRLVAKATGWLLHNTPNLFFFCPIAHSEAVGMVCALPGDWHFWAEFDECLISRCAELWILCIPGWSKSTGVNAERAIAVRLGLPIKFVIPQDDGTYLTIETEPVDPYADAAPSQVASPAS